MLGGGNQCDQMSEQKVAQIFTKATKIVSSAFYLKSGIFQNSPKGHHQLFWLLL